MFHNQDGGRHITALSFTTSKHITEEAFENINFSRFWNCLSKFSIFVTTAWIEPVKRGEHTAESIRTMDKPYLAKIRYF